MKEKRGVSPVIATILLVGMVMVLAIIIFLWVQGMTAETITKFGGKNVELVCGEVAFDASYSSGKLYISNNGNVPIFNMELKKVKAGSHEVEEISNLDSAWDKGLGQGGTFDVDLPQGEMKEIIVTPVLLGNSDRGKRTYACDETQFGKKITI